MLSNVIKRFKTGVRHGVYYATRTVDGGFDVNGYPLPPTFSKVRFEASVQPVSDDFLKVLPDGVRVEDTALLITSTELHASTPTQRPDIVDIDGQPYTVVHAHGPWELGRSIHWECVIHKNSAGNAS